VGWNGRGRFPAISRFPPRQAATPEFFAAETWVHGGSLGWRDARLSGQAGLVVGGLDRRADRGFVVAQFRQQDRVVPQYRVAMRMRMTGITLEGEEDDHHAPHQRFRVRPTVGGLEQ
jgi:hypothetical protein